MALREAIQALIACLEQLERDDLGHLHWAVTQGRPQRRPRIHRQTTTKHRVPAQYLPRRYGELSLELVHAARDAGRAAKKLLAEAAEARPTMQLTSAFSDCDQHVESIANALLQDFESEQMALLQKFSEEKGKGWPAWASGVNQALPPCRRRLHETHRAMIQLLREMAERGNPSAVVVHNQCSGPTLHVGQNTTPEVAGVT